MTPEQENEMCRVFPDGWDASDVPAFWRKDEEEARQKKGEEIEDIN